MPPSPQYCDSHAIAKSDLQMMTRNNHSVKMSASGSHYEACYVHGCDTVDSDNVCRIFGGRRWRHVQSRKEKHGNDKSETETTQRLLYVPLQHYMYPYNTICTLTTLYVPLQHILTQ
jgi:hypothetical protein